MNKFTRNFPPREPTKPVQDRVEDLLSKMTLEEKIGQLQQVDASTIPVPDEFIAKISRGEIGSIINQTDPDICNAMQKAAVENSRLGIPLLIGRDVIHGFRTIAPIPLGQAATWNPDLVRDIAQVAAREARSQGVHWTFAPMIDISRDPRWGRIAESFGEDPYLTSVLGVAMLEGFQGNDLSAPDSIAACAKHFVGYGASESGRDYNTTNIPANELRNVYLPPFKALVDAGIATVMTSFSDIDGVPATANADLVEGVLRQDWGFDGLIVSDWNAIGELVVHGLSEDNAHAVIEAVTAGIDMDMAGGVYEAHLADHVASGLIDERKIDEMVSRVLRLKFDLGLFEQPYAQPDLYPPLTDKSAREIAYQAALESFVLLKNDADTLPLQSEDVRSIAIIGPLGDAPHEQLGTWIFDGLAEDSVTPLAALKATYGTQIKITHVPGLSTSRDRRHDQFEAAEAAARESDVAIVLLGEESILSGEAHSRADISLPGAQSELLQRVHAASRKTVTVIMAGRPLTIERDLPHTDALLFAWHPGTMGGPALIDLIFGVHAPSGKLPVTFPRSVGQIPIYYNHKTTGRPPVADDMVLIDDIEEQAKQTSLGMSSFHLDDGHLPLFPFGFGLSYADFTLSDLKLNHWTMRENESIKVSVKLTNSSVHAGATTVQLYLRDVSASVTRPVRELKKFRKVSVAPNSATDIVFELKPSDLAFYRRDKSFGPEAGEFKIWVSTNAQDGLSGEFQLAI